MTSTSLKKFLTLTALTLLATACTRNNTGLDQPQNTSDIFSNRPIGSMKTVAILTLSEPPLLKVATKTALGWNIPLEAKTKLLVQQTAVEASLKKISPDISVLFRYHMTINGLAVIIDSNLIPELAKIS